MLVPRAVDDPLGVDVIINRRARRLRGDGALLRVLRGAGALSPARVRLHETSSLADLESVACDLEARGTSLVVLAGGDGSYLAGTTALCRAFGETLPLVAFAPGGTVSGVARNWGVRGGDAAYTKRLLAAGLAGETRQTERPTLRVRDDRGGDRVGFIFGAGLVARFFDDYYAASVQGTATAAALVARIFVGSFLGGELATRVLTPAPSRLIVDGVERESPVWSLIAASVVPDLGLHLRLLYRAAERLDAFHVVASSLPARRLSPQVGRVLLGRPLRGEGRVDTLARELVVDGIASYVLDGERIATGRVTVTPGPVLRYASV